MYNGKKIEQLRTRRGWARAELAERSGLTRQTIINLESGVNTNPTADTLQAIAHALAVDVRELFKGA
jgi:transcriptional regulator with XRE-family HTH domain